MNLTDNCKSKCQIFTPTTNVNELLDWIGYNKNLYGKKILEPSFGKGNIIIEIVKRYINDCIESNISIDLIREGLENDIYGVEYDSSFFNICWNLLDDIASNYNINNVKWNIQCEDSLEKEYEIKFDFIVGNPPYISYTDLDNATRKMVRKKFSVCNDGKFDYCYAFIEKGINLLSKNGKLAYLIPSSIFKNIFSKKLRELMLSDLVSIHDYGSRKLFNEQADGTKRKILTTSAVIVIERQSNCKHINYFNEEEGKKRKILKKDLSEKWIFSENTNCGRYRFGDYFKASNSIATLYNEAYVINEENDLFDNKKESKIIKETVSPKTLESGKKEKIIFPYYYEKGKLKRIPLKKFEEKFPSICSHLHKYDQRLKERKSDNNISWFEYGRSQALIDMNQPKLLTSIIITHKMRVYYLNKNIIPYSGIYIISISDWSLDRAIEILNSDDFYYYIKSIGINVSGNSFRITSRDINNYYFD